jgi:hypothetical protein
MSQNVAEISETDRQSHQFAQHVNAGWVEEIILQN